MSPGPFGGNMDNKELVAGSILYLPVQVPGALLSFNDSHGLQADGEISISAFRDVAARYDPSLREEGWEAAVMAESGDPGLLHDRRPGYGPE